MIRKILPRVLVLLIIIGGVTTYYLRAVDQPETNLYYGEGVPVSFDVYTKVPGILERVLVVEGDSVSEGMVVAKMESNEAQLMVEKAALAKTLAETGLDKTGTPVRDQEFAIQENNILLLESQKASLEASLNGIRQSYSQSKLNETTLKATYDYNLKIYEDGRSLYEAGAETKQALDALLLSTDNSKLAYDSAKLNSQRIYSELTSAQEQFTALDLQIDSAKEQLSLMEEGTLSEDVTISQLNLNLAEKDEKLAQLSLTNHEIQTYDRGLVSEVYYDPGEFIGAGSAIMTVYQPDHLKVHLYVAEKDLSLFETGMTLGLHLVVKPEVEVIGTVGVIATEPMFTPVNTVVAEDRERLVFKVEVNLEMNDRVRPGMLLATDLLELE